MTALEFSTGFDTLVSSYRNFGNLEHRELLDSIEFDEFEKSFFLTMSENEVVVNLYTGKNVYGDSFENTEELRRYLDELVKTSKPDKSSETDLVGVSSNSVFYDLPDDIAFIVYEQVTWNDATLGCGDGAITSVYPITHDEYHKVRKNPFRGPTKLKVLRLDAGENKVELVSKYAFKDYMIRYIAQPEPILLENFSGAGVTVGGRNGAGITPDTEVCKLNPILHDVILKRAVQMALASKGIQIS